MLPLRPRTRRPGLLALLSLSIVTGSWSFAPGAPNEAVHGGLTPVRAEEPADGALGDPRILDARLLAAPDAARAERLARELGAGPRVAGTAAGAAAAEWIAARLREAGLDPEIRSYDVYLPHATSARAWRIDGGARELAATPAGSDSYPAAAGYSAAGDVTGRVIYANYGSRSDFAALRALGVRVEGAVVLIRFGNVFRGMKVRNAEAEGAAAVLLFSDPQQDGFVRGEVMPAGPFRPADAIQRGSVKIGLPGDPTTPGWPSLPGAEHDSPEGEEAGLPGVPVLSIGYGAAQDLLADLGGPVAPRDWQGGLPLTYRLGDGAVRARVAVTLDDAPMKRIHDVIARIPGREAPDEWVIAGAHYDSWTAGATDNVSGTIALLEAARALGAMRAAGIRPRRSIVLAAWDAEEWGLIGSGEWVEEHAPELAAGGVAYVNLDGVAGGPFFYASATPSVARLLRDVTHLVPDPTFPALSVHEAWRRRSRAEGEPVIGLPGGGSDDANFSARTGIPVVSFGFTADAGVYHSDRDDTAFMERFGDPGYRQHAAVAAIAAMMAWRLADAGMVPLDYRDYARFLSAAMRPLSLDPGRDLEVGALRAAVTAFARTASQLDTTARTRPTGRDADRDLLALASSRLLRVERRMTRSEGLPGRAWYRNVVIAPHPDDSYGVAIFPALGAALRGEDPGAWQLEILDLTMRIRAATAELEAARQILAGGRDLRVAD